VCGAVSAMTDIKTDSRMCGPPQVVVATPGRLWDLMKTGESAVTDLRALSFLVIDEADRMVQQGHFQVGNRLPHSITGGSPSRQWQCGWPCRTWKRVSSIQARTLPPNPHTP
jgi:superfamily II DNA/RNA helicase